MTDILIYLLKVSLAISMVTIPYYLWLRQDASLNIKRFYMTGGILLSWLISRMIKENHEHLADRTVLLRGVNPAHYKAQLLNHAMGVELFRLGNQFNHSLTKKRFQMMK